MTPVRDRCHQAPLAGRHSHTGTYHGRHKAHGHRVLSSATPSVLGDFTHHFIRNEGAVAKFSFGRLGSRPPPPVGQGPATATAPAGPERHCRERRGPSAGDGLGNRGAIRASSRCTDREHGGTQAVSRRPGSPREARREGPTRAAHLISRQLSLEACRRCFLLSIDPHVVDPEWRDDLPHLADDGSVGDQSARVPGLVTSAESAFRAGNCSMRLFGMRPTGRPRECFIMKAFAAALPRG